MHPPFPEWARMAIQAFVTSRIDYCNAALLGLGSASIDRVQPVMNSAARLLLKLPKFSHISVRMRDELPVSLRIQFKVTFTMWRCIAGYAPDYARSLSPTLHNLRPSQTRSFVASRFLLEVPRARTVTMQKRAFTYMQDRPCGTICLRQFGRPLCLSAQIQLTGEKSW